MLDFHRLPKHIWVFLACCASASFAADQVNVEHWDRNSAMAAVHASSAAIEARQLSDISSLPGGETLQRLKILETRDDWPLPAREAAIYQFTQSLADLPRDAVAEQVMQYLLTYQARVLVPHEDHRAAFVPLFNIRGAAAGVEHSWQRLEFGAEATNMLTAEPGSLVAAYLRATSHTQRSGYLDGLRQSGLDEISLVQSTALQGLASNPSLTPLIATTAVITGDISAIQKLLVNGQGAGVSPALMQLQEQLHPSETAGLLAFAIQQAPTGNASLAIAAWGPALHGHSASRELLITTLANPDLGAAAALALAQNPDIQTIRDLQVTAGKDSIAGQRAQMALDINRAQLTGGNQP